MENDVSVLTCYGLVDSRLGYNKRVSSNLSEYSYVKKLQITYQLVAVVTFLHVYTFIPILLLLLLLIFSIISSKRSRLSRP